MLPPACLELQLERFRPLVSHPSHDVLVSCVELEMCVIALWLVSSLHVALCECFLPTGPTFVALQVHSKVEEVGGLVHCVLEVEQAALS